MQTKIVTMPSAKIREVARVAMEGYWLQVALFMGFYYLISTGVSNILDMFFVTTQSVPIPETGESYVQSFYYGSAIYASVVGGPLSWAMSKFLLDFFRYQKVEHTTILEGFSHFVRTVLLELLMGVKILLWSLLFVVPGVIAAYRYSQAYYVMVDHPEYSASQCIAESCRIMNGNKMKYFKLNLSFIGWTILAMVPAFCFTNQLANADGIAYVLLDFAFAIPVFFVNAYMNVGMTVFYELATDNLTIVMEDTPADTYVKAQTSAEEAVIDVPVIEEPEEPETTAETEEFRLPEE